MSRFIILWGEKAAYTLEQPNPIFVFANLCGVLSLCVFFLFCLSRSVAEERVVGG